MTSSAAIGQPPTFIEVGEGNAARRIAVRAREGGAPGLFWLGGFNSDMQGTKALALDAWAAEHGRACVRFDYSGHGESGGAFIDGTIGRWLEESVAVFEQFCAGPQVVIGSSMGGWMALLLAREIAKRPQSRASLAGLVLIAPAPDFTEQLMWNGFSPEVKKEIESKGVWLRPSQYGDGAPYPITRALIEEGRNHLLLGSAIDVGCPVRILQGAQDPDVPWQHAFALAHRLPSRRRGADHDPGRRSPPVAAAGHRADPRGRCRDRFTGRNAMNTSAMLRAFCDAVEQRNGAAFAELFTEDGVYHDVFYGAFTGRAKIAGMIDDWFYRTATDFRWDMHDPVSDGETLYARYTFSYRSLLPEAKGARAMFEGVAIMRLRDGKIAEYHEVANTATGFVDMNFAPERMAKIFAKQGAALKARPEMKRHLD